MLQRLAGMELDVAATAIGVAPDVLRSAVNDGRSIAELAADAGVPSDRVVDAVVRDANTKVDRAVADGRMAADRASLLRSRLPNWAQQLVVQTPRMLAGTGSGPAMTASHPSARTAALALPIGSSCAHGTTALIGRNRVTTPASHFPDVSAAS